MVRGRGFGSGGHDPFAEAALVMIRAIYNSWHCGFVSPAAALADVELEVAKYRTRRAVADG